MVKKIYINKIPRTIYGVKYDYGTEGLLKYKNNIEYFSEKKHQLGFQKHCLESEGYSEIKLLKWLIKPE